MSQAARFSYTFLATIWPTQGRDDWTGRTTYGPPQTFVCDYSAESKRMVDAQGIEFTTRQTIYTERADIKQGDFVLIGESAALDPLAAGAIEVRMITRDADTFDRVADDFKVMT